MKTRKVVIIGAGHVGSHVALGLIQSGEADDIVLIDILKEKAAAQALDLDDCVSGALCGHDAVIRAGEYEELNDADIMVVAFGRSRKPGETRLDMFDDTIRMANEVIGHLKQVDFKGIMISISNPADIICEYIRRQMNWQTNGCFCTGTSLETYRLLRVLSAATGYSRRSIQAMCMGEHGNSSFIVWSRIFINGTPFLQMRENIPDKGITLEAAVPFPDQPWRWKEEVKREYESILSWCDKVHFLPIRFLLLRIRRGIDIWSKVHRF